MTASLSAFETCDLILAKVKSSNLNFVIQETPFSNYLTIRKSFNKSKGRLTTSEVGGVLHNLNTFSKIPTDHKESEVNSLKSKLSFLQSKVNHLEESKAALDKNYGEEVINCENVEAKLKDEITKLNNLHKSFETLEARFRNIAAENRKIVEKYQTSLTEEKRLKSDNAELNSDVNNLNVVIKTLKKEAKEKRTEFEKDTNKLLETVQQLETYKVIKSSEEKALRNKHKKLDKRLKEIANIKHADLKAPMESLGLDFNENESAILEATVLTSNSFESLANLEFESSNEKEAEIKIGAKVNKSLTLPTSHSLLVNPISYPSDMFNMDLQEVNTSPPCTNSPSTASRSPHTPPRTPPTTGSTASFMTTPRRRTNAED